MNIEALLASMTPEIYERLRQAVETGKWPDGTPLNEEQNKQYAGCYAVSSKNRKVL